MKSSDLVLQSVCRSFGAVRAVDEVSLRIAPGEFVGVIGRSGAGKSTLLRLVNRLIEPTSGRITYGDREITSLTGRALRVWRRECAMIFQQFNLVERMDVLSNVLVGRIAEKSFLSSMSRHYSDAERVLALRAIERLDLTGQALQAAGTLSGGQQQRVAIARALMQSPRIMLADEPIASLDPSNAVRVMDCLRAINREDGITVLVNLHTIETARAYCSRIIAMAGGRVVFDGPAASLDDGVLAAVYGGAGALKSGEEDQLGPVLLAETA